MLESLVRLLNVSFYVGTVPIDWHSECIIHLYDGKGDKYECINSKSISFKSVVGKLDGRVPIKTVMELNGH